MKIALNLTNYFNISGYKFFMKTNRTRILFVLLFCFLFVQYLYSMKISEPYPAIKFPEFGKVYPTSGKIKFTKYEVLAFSSAGNSDSINAVQLFHPIDKNYVPGILNNILKKQNQPANPQEYNEFKSFVFSRLQEMNHKQYVKLEIRKLEVFTNADFGNSNKQSTIKEKVEIAF